MATLTLGATGLTVAQAAYPSKPLHIMLPLPGGGMSDLVARLLADKLHAHRRHGAHAGLF